MAYEIVYFDRTREEECPYDPDLMINPTVTIKPDVVLFSDGVIGAQHMVDGKAVITHIPIADLYEFCIFDENNQLVRA